ncbi:retrovirus-related pol polyprotein from transposon TNT 1-94 [Tanacetum coccineum]
MTTLADKSLLSGGDNKPPMLEKHLYDSWKSIMELYMMNRPHGRMILASVEKGPLVWPTITVDGVTRPKEYTELTPAETIQADCDIKAINIILQGLPTEIYALQERECKLYDEFDKFTYKKGESLHEYYLRFTLLLNDMNIYKMPLEQFQVNTKFLNTLPAEWSKFVTDVKLVKDLHTTNVDQIHAHLEQHEQHQNEVRWMPRTQLQSSCFSCISPNDTVSLSISSALLPKLSTSTIFTSRYPTTNNQLRNSLNLRQQATINDGRVTVQPVQGRQISYAVGTIRTFTPGASGSNSGKQRIVTCYNCKGEGHMSKQCTKLRRKWDDSWFKDKVLLVAIQNSNSSAQQDELILFVFEQLKTQVANCTKINLENKRVNDTLTTELERYKEQVKVLMKDKSVEIDHHKQTLSEHLKEKEFLIQTVSLLKDDFKKEESRNIDREIALEKRIKQLDNIIFKRDQSAKTVHMLTKPQLFYDHTTKQAIGFQNPFYLKKAQQLEPTLYVGDIIEETNPILIPDSEETLMLAEENFETRIVPQTELSAEQAFWSQKSVNSPEPILSSRPTIVEEIFQRDNPVSNQIAPSFDQLFELNELKAQSQEKDTVIKKMKERIKYLSGKQNEDKIKNDLEEIEIKDIELDHRVTKLIAENEHLKQTYKQLYDSIKSARIRSKEQCDDLINQVNLKSVEIFDLNASLQEKVLVITALKNDLRKLKGKALVDNDVTKHPSDPKMLKIDVEPITPKLLNKQTAHSAYIKHTQEEATELLTNISKTCPSVNNTDGKLVVVTPKNKDKTVTKTTSTSNLVSNKPMLSSTGVKPSTSASGTQPSGNTKKDKIQQTPSSTQKNKVEAHPRKVKSSLKNKDCVVEPKGTAHVQHSKLNANSKLKCVKCNGCMLSDNHDLCVLDFINNVNARVKSKSAKKNSKRKV